jgi:hypothetical protein
MRRLFALSELAILFMAAAGATEFKKGQKVILEVRPGFENWGLTDTCMNAYLAFTDQSLKRKADWTATYGPGTIAVVQEVDEDGWCVLIDRPEGDGWVYKDLVKLTSEAKGKVAAEKKKLAEQKTDADAKARAHREYLTSLPHLSGATDKVPVAVDAGCLADMRKARSLEGLERRKKIAELLAYGCIFMAPSGTHVRATKRADGSYAVDLEDSAMAGKSGIIESEFLGK